MPCCGRSEELWPECPEGVPCVYFALPELNSFPPDGHFQGPHFPKWCLECVCVRVCVSMTLLETSQNPWCLLDSFC